MSEPCHQQPSMHRMEQKIDSLADAVAQLAVQRNEIEHLVKSDSALREWMKGHETRLQLLEKAPGAAASRLVWMVVGGGFGLICSITLVYVNRSL